MWKKLAGILAVTGALFASQAVLPATPAQAKTKVYVGIGVGVPAYPGYYPGYYYPGYYVPAPVYVPPYYAKPRYRHWRHHHRRYRHVHYRPRWVRRCKTRVKRVRYWSRRYHRWGVKTVRKRVCYRVRVW